jgi:peroxiredoxin
MDTKVRPLRAGDRAPDFELPAVNGEGTVSLADYRGKSAVFVALFRGLHCPFCRRQLARLSTTQEKLAHEGVATVAIVNTQPERARQYFKYRPTPVVLAADPDVQTHRAFGLPKFDILPDSTDPGQLRWPQNTTMQQLWQVPSLAAAGEVPEARSFLEAAGALNTRDGFEMMPADEESYARHAGVLEGQFLIDASGTIRWSSVEAPDGPGQMGVSPSDEEIIAAARHVLH